MPQYQGVWTLEQQAQAQSNQQWVTDPNFKNTTLLLQADGTGSGSQNNTFLDGSTNNFFITRNGNTTQGSFSPFSQAPGYWSNFLNGSSYLQTPSSTNYAFGTGDFTIEAFFFPTATTANLRLFEFSDNNDNVGANTTSTGTITYFNGSTNTVSTGLPFTANQWNHVAVVRSSGTVTVYVNGTSALTQASTPNTTSARSVGIGGISNTYFPGYVSNVRILKGTAAYTATFTPPTAPLTAITNTQLLTCQSNRFVDNSVNGVSFTIGSAPQVQAFGPFAPALQWTPDVVGGSLYGDGSSDYLTVATNANLTLGSSDFTIELWYYPLAYSSAGELFSMVSTSATNRCYAMYTYNNDGTLGAYAGTGGTSWDIVSNLNMGKYVLNQWNHIAFTRSGSTFSTYLNGNRIATTTATGTLGSNGLGIFADNLGGTQGPSGYMGGARTIKGTALYTGSTYTIPTTPFSAVTNTNFLLGCTNAGIYDGKMANNLETVGSAQVATSPVKYGSGSMYFDGSGDYLLFQNAPNFTFGTGDFTIEFWAFFISTTGNCIDFRPNVTNGAYPAIYISSGSLRYYANTADQITSSSTLVANTWYHIAVCRANSQTRMFVNGIQTGSTYADTTNYLVGTSRPTIGISANDLSSLPLNGYLDDLRITKGVARYIANFTPPQQALPRQ